MLSTLAKLAQKPSDKTIRLTRIGFALVLTVFIVLGWSVTRTEGGLPDWVRYILVVFPIIGLVRGILDPGLWHKRIWKWVVMGSGISMFLISALLIEDAPLQRQSGAAPTSQTGINVAEIVADAPVSGSFTLSTDNWFYFFAVILIIVGFFLNNKNLTTKNEKFGEKVTKIRV